MKAKTIIILSAVLLSACGPSKAELEANPEYYGYKPTNLFHTIIIDSCEYIYKDEYKTGTILVHKSNCKNKFHLTHP